MKQTLTLAAVVVAVLLILWGLIPQVGTPVRPQAANAPNKVKQLLVASYAFYLDRKRETPDDAAYPNSFSDLVPSYLSQNDLEKLTSNLQIDYFPPNEEPIDGQTVIVARTSGFVIYGLAPFDVRWHKVK